MMQQSKLNILVTGASRGIGAAIARQLGSVHNIVLLGRDQQALNTTATQISDGNVAVMQCDIRSTSDVQHVCSSIGAIDVVVNNAGVAEFADAVDQTLESEIRQIETNLIGPITLIRELLPGMIARERGMVITVNSIAAVTVFRGAAAYSASKAGMLAYTRSLRQETREHGIKVIDLLVGATDTEIWSVRSRQEHAHRMLSSQHIADVVQTLVDSFDDKRLLIEEITIRPQLGDL